MKWHAVSAEALYRELHTDAERELTAAEAARRLSEHGPERSGRRSNSS